MKTKKIELKIGDQVKIVRKHDRIEGVNSDMNWNVEMDCTLYKVGVVERINRGIFYKIRFNQNQVLYRNYYFYPIEALELLEQLELSI